MKIGIDIGGSHIAVGLVDDNKNILLKKEYEIKISDKSQPDKFLIEEIIKYTNELLKEKNLQKSNIELIGIAIPGTIKNGKILKSINLNIKNFYIVSELKKCFNIPLQIRNDAKCATLAEKYCGSMKKYKDFVYICLGTGIGSGVVINNQLLEPQRYEGFELGHMTIEKNGILCNCGQKGCWEQYASMRVLKNSLIKNLNLKEDVKGKDLLNLLKNNSKDKNINIIIDEYINNLSIGIENIINIFEPEAICIGGSFVYYKELLLDKLEKKLKERNVTFNNKTIPNIICAQLKNDSGIIGAIL